MMTFQVSIVTKLRLLKYFKSDELPEELGGLFTLNHEQWLKSRIVSEWHSVQPLAKPISWIPSRLMILYLIMFTPLPHIILQRIEDFRKSFNKTTIDLDAFIESMQDLKMMRATEISEILRRRSGNNIEMQNIVKMILKNGKAIIIHSFV